mmetsp:Transcript_33860/g.89271  ORF Transcript_33860/g.89271 Transcript_33860/m.89271 type:complete len:207 (+) Transcript_33860:385-1005(+)
MEVAAISVLPKNPLTSLRVDAAPQDATDTITIRLETCQSCHQVVEIAVTYLEECLISLPKTKIQSEVPALFFTVIGRQQAEIKCVHDNRKEHRIVDVGVPQQIRYRYGLDFGCGDERCLLDTLPEEGAFRHNLCALHHVVTATLQIAFGRLVYEIGEWLVLELQDVFYMHLADINHVLQHLGGLHLLPQLCHGRGLLHRRGRRPLR